MKPFNAGTLAVMLFLAAAVNAAGYLLSLWHDETLFDEAVHFYTSFAVIAAAGSAAIRRSLGAASPKTLFWGLIAVGLAVGLLWEAFEWVIGIIGGRVDTLLDLTMDIAGALLAAVLMRRWGGAAD